MGDSMYYLQEHNIPYQPRWSCYSFEAIKENFDYMQKTIEEYIQGDRERPWCEDERIS